MLYLYYGDAMKNITIDKVETIKELVRLTDNPRYIATTKKAIANHENLTEDDVLFITTMSIGEAIKKIIPERQYKRLIIRVWPEEKESRSYGYIYEENGKYIVTYSKENKNMLMNKDVPFERKMQCFFTFAHELYHAKQAIDAKEERITFDSFMYCLEEGLHNNIQGFYKKEYDNLYLETIAEGIGIMLGAEFLNKYGKVKEDDVGKLIKILMNIYKPNYHVFENDNELKEYIKRLLQILRDNINNFDIKFEKNIFIRFPMLKYLIHPKTGELESPERLQELINNTYMMEDNSDNKERLRLLKILKELSIERQQSNSYK